MFIALVIHCAVYNRWSVGACCYVDGFERKQRQR